MDSSIDGASGRYRLIERIGSGGMANVYLAEDEVLHRRVAVKVLNAESTGDPIFVERFRREAQAAAQLNHPNIVAIYDWGRFDGTDGMVMEHVPGESLKERLRHGPLPEAEALDVAGQVAAALRVAHDRGIVHRDVKPQNILLSAFGLVKVADFGIAFTAGLSHLTKTHAVSGTAHYLSPEQAQSKAVDHRSDLYSLGVVLYEMLVGREPFQGATLVEIAMRHVTDNPIPPRVIRPDLSPMTNAVVLKALAKSPAERYQNAGEMRDALLEARAAAAPSKTPAAVTTPVPFLPERALDRGSQRPSKIGMERMRSAGSKESRWVRRVLMAIPALLLLLVALPFVLPHRGSHARHTPRVAAAPSHPPGDKSADVRRRQARVRRALVTPPRHLASRSTPPPGPAAAPTVALAPAAPASRVHAASTDSDPGAAVTSFYSDIASKNFAGAAALWTAAMQAQCPPLTCIDSRFSNTQWVQMSTPVVLRSDASSATVQINLLDKELGEAEPRDYRGVWRLVRAPQGWLLDGENLTRVLTTGQQ